MKKGFTLLEIMIVIAIMGILLAIAIPKFAQLAENNRRTKQGLPPLTMQEFCNRNKNESDEFLYNYDYYIVREFCRYKRIHMVINNSEIDVILRKSNYMQKEFEKFCEDKGIRLQNNNFYKESDSEMGW